MARRGLVVLKRQPGQFTQHLIFVSAGAALAQVLAQPWHALGRCLALQFKVNVFRDLFKAL